MGSLVPGWDTAQPGPPKDLQEIDEAKELMEGQFHRTSYFERLEKSKTMRRNAADADHPSSLDRSPSLGSRPPHSDVGGLGLSKSFQPSSTMPMERPSLQRNSISTTGGGVGSTVSPKAGPGKYVATDWEAEISALGSPKSSRRSSLGRTSVDSLLAHKHEEGSFQRPSWWAQLDSGRMNDAQADDRAAQVEEAPGHGGSVKIDFIGSNLS